MSQVSLNPLTIRTLLLFQQHTQVHQSTLPLLIRLQALLNESYTATYCAHPSIFGTNHVRIAHPSQIADIIEEDGFTITLLSVKGRTEDGDELMDVVATGSVKNFGAGDVEKYAQWSKNVSGTQWAAKSSEQRANAKVNVAGQQSTENGREDVRLEITAFAVSPLHQGLGLGARILSDIEWLVSRFAPATNFNSTGKPGLVRIASPPVFKGAALSSTVLKQVCPIIGVDMDILKESHEQGSKRSRTANEESLGTPVSGQKLPKLVLMGIRELGNEDYYRRRGYKSVWAGTVPVGMWDCLKECTMVFMEKELLVPDV